MSGNDPGKESGNPSTGTSERVGKPAESDSAFKKYPELYENDEVVKRQMEMISESLAACKRMSKRRSPKKEVNVASKPEVVPMENPTGKPPDVGREYHGHFDVGDDSIPAVSYILKEKTEKRDEIREEKQEIIPESFPELAEVSDRKESSQIGMYEPEEVDPGKMMEVIQRELKSLLEMAPVVSSTVNELFDTVLHYQTCSKCKAKIRSSLPWILNTIQELVKHVTKKRRGTYVWPNECSYLRLPSIHSQEKESLQKKEEEEEEEVGKDTKAEIVLGELKKVDAITTSDCKPGLQIELEVKPEKTKKKFFSRKIQLSKSGDHSLEESYSTERPKESSYNFLFRVEKPSRLPEISWTVKRSILASRGFASAVLFLTRFRCSRILSGLVLVPGSWVTVRPGRRISNGVSMQVEKMKELEAEVKGLKDLMLEVHKNQMELSKVLMEKGVYSQTIIRLTDPKMLEEENEVVRKAAQMEITQQETSSTESLQRAVDDLKRKCAVKNRMIVTLLRGLRTDVPKEWWEELVDYVFAESKPNGEFEPEMMTAFVRHTSAYLLNKKTSEEPVLREEEKPSEEEGQRKWKRNPEVEWNVLFEDLLSTTTREVSASSEANGGLSPSIPTPFNFFTFPASIEFDSKPEVMIKKLENQVSLLNAENDRLWNEVNDLRTLLKASVEESSEVEDVSNRSSRGLSEVIKTSGRTINLTIQIGDKDSRRSSRMKVKTPSVEEWCLERGKSKSSPIVKCVTGECDIFPEVGPRPNLSEHERKIHQKLLTDTRYQFRSKPNRNRSDVDLIALDDTSPSIPDYVRKEGNERLRNFLRDKIESVHHVMVATPRPSQHDFDRDFKYPTNVSEAGPSKESGNRRPNLTNLFLKPSMIQLVEKPSQSVTSPSPTITNERELQTIPENDSTFSTTSDSCQSVDQAIQVLRAKVKSIYKDVTVLKSKNDRMDKLLDRLLGEALENRQSFEEVGSQVLGLRERHSSSLKSRATSDGSSSKDDQEYSDASSQPETANQNDSESESDYKTGNEDLNEENGDGSRTEIRKATSKRLTQVWETSSFVQNLLYEDSQTGVAVVDLFVAVKSAKNSIDDLAYLNNTVHEKLVSLAHETELIQTGYEDLVRTMTSFFDRVKAESRAWKSESEAIGTQTVKNISQPEVNTATDKPATEIGRFCSSCGFVRYLRENVTCPLCKGEIIVREKCSDCAAVEISKRRTEKCESCRLSICQYCGLPELKNKKAALKESGTESHSPEKMEKKRQTGNDEKTNESFEQVRTSSTQHSRPGSPSPSPVTPSSGGSIPSQASSKVVESLFRSLVSHVLRSEEDGSSTGTTRESLLSSLLTSKSGLVVSHKNSKQGSEGTTSLSDSTVQMICEICGILGMIGPQGRSLEATPLASHKASKLGQMEGDQGDKPTQSPPTDLDSSQLTTVSDTRTKGKRENSIITIYLPENLTTGHEDKKPEQSSDDRPVEEQTGSIKTPQTEPAETEDNSEGEVFEEALSEPYMSLPSLSVSRHVKCMGDLTKEVTKMSKSVSTLTATNEFVSSWIGKIAEDIKTKIRNLKTGSGQVSVADEKTSDKGSKKLSTALEFTISADTPVGVFDVTIRQYRDSRRKLRDGSLSGVVPTLVSDSDKFVPVEMKTLRDGGQYWSDESLLLSDSDHVGLTSCSEEEMEEFVEVYVQSRKKTISTSGFVSKPEKGLVKEMSLLHGKPLFVEMVRLQPKTFVQEIIPKTEKFISRKDDRQEKKEVKEGGTTPEVETNTGSMLVLGKGSGGRRNDEEQGSLDSANSPNNSNISDRSFNDLVICIQIDVDDQEEAEERSRANNQIYIDLKVGGQEGQKNCKGRECVYLISKGEISPVAEGVEDNVKDIWTGKDSKALEDSEREAEEGRITFNETPVVMDKETENSTEEVDDDQDEELDSNSYESVESDDSETKRTMRGKSVTFRDEFSDVLAEKEIKEVMLEPEPEAEPKAKTWARADTIAPIQKANQVEVHHLQHKRFHVVQLDPRTSTLSFFLTRTNDELQAALNLIQEIETNIIKVKLSEAINILPVLESELRKHLRDKMKGMAGRKSASRETSVDNFFSAVEVWPREETIEISQGSEERFKYLLKLLSDLEEAVKSRECSEQQICQNSSSRIYNLLQALTNSIRGLEDDTTMGNLSETVEIASQLDTAVREFDDIVKKKPADYVKADNEGKPEHLVKDEPLVKDHLTNVRKRVFEMVEEDAIETEERIEMDFDRIDRLERENEESMKFVEAFLEKTLRRSTELTNLRTELKNLSSVLSDMYQELSKAKERKERSSTRSASPPTKELAVRDTVSSLLLALDKLKTRAREKNEACKEILGTIASATSNRKLFLDRKSSRSSKSSYTTKSAEGLVSSVKEFKKIGQRSLYLAWSKPEGILSDSIVGYEILVNGKLNQKVRNPQRQQAVLYSVDLSQTAEVQLLGLIENGSKVLLAIVTYLDL